MFENIVITAMLVGLIIFQISSIKSLNSDLERFNSLSEKNDERFKLFCEISDYEKSVLVDKKGCE